MKPNFYHLVIVAEETFCNRFLFKQVFTKYRPFIDMRNNNVRLIHLSNCCEQNETPFQRRKLLFPTVSS